MNVVCIIQARVGSTRLPNKVLKEICGKTVLEHDIDRLKRIKNIDRIVIATTTETNDNAIVEEAQRLGVDYFRGSENDVLSRYYYAAKESDANAVVRVTSDCPLIDSEISEKIIEFYIENTDQYDYVSNTIDRTYPRGLDVEVFSFKVLEEAFTKANEPREREHVTPFIWNKENDYRVYQYKGDEDFSDLRWTLDTEDDLKLIKKVYDLLNEKYGNNFKMQDVIKLYEDNKELYDINSEVKQKEI